MPMENKSTYVAGEIPRARRPAVPLIQRKMSKERKVSCGQGARSIPGTLEVTAPLSQGDPLKWECGFVSI